MFATTRLPIRSLAAMALVALAGSESYGQSKPAPRSVLQRTDPPRTSFTPSRLPPPAPLTQPLVKKPLIVGMPSVNSVSTMPMLPTQQTQLLNHWTHTHDNAFMNPWNDPFAVNPVPAPWMMNPMFWNQPINNPLIAPNPIVGCIGPAPVLPQVAFTPPMAIKLPGILIPRGLDLRVNATSGVVHRPLSGIVTLPDGSTFYRVPGTGVTLANGIDLGGTGLYYNPLGGTFFNPSSGVLSQPARANAFLPYVW